MLGRLGAHLEGHRGRRRLVSWLPALASLDDDLRQARHRLGPSLEGYARAVSSADMALSLQTAAFLEVMCDRLRPARVLDAGSGFSSSVLRAYARRHPDRAEVWSVDDSAEWLEKTRAFLLEQGLDPAHLEVWDEFQRLESGRFDLVLHDLGRVTARARTLEHLLPRLADQGLLLLDDFHKRGYRRQASRLLAGRGFELASLRAYTLDGYGRFACLARRAGARG